MRTSQFPLQTLKETPSDASIASHKLMLRAGMIRKLASGLYNWLPLGLRVLRKVETIVREEMNRAGAIEVLLPALQPAEQEDRPEPQPEPAPESRTPSCVTAASRPSRISPSETSATVSPVSPAPPRTARFLTKATRPTTPAMPRRATKATRGASARARS